MGTPKTLKRRRQRKAAKERAIARAIYLANRTPEQIARDRKFAEMTATIAALYLPSIRESFTRDTALFRMLNK